MKKISLLSLVFLLAIFGCESENDNELKDVTRSILTKSKGGSFTDFNDLFASLYGKDYFVNKEVSKISADGETYSYTSVYIVINGGELLRGYLLEVPGDVLYYEHDSSTGKLTEYNFADGKYLSETFPTIKDPVYSDIGFNPENPVLTGRRFWGWDYSGPGKDIHKDPIGGGCYRLMTETYYVFGVGIIGPREIEGLRMPADCPE